jgi:putative transposase
VFDLNQKNERNLELQQTKETLMTRNNVISLPSPADVCEPRSALESLIREGARQMLEAALRVEVATYLQQFENVFDLSGKRVVVRNGYMPERDVTTGIGPLRVKQPRVRDRSGSQKFTSRILPVFARRVPSVDALIPALYLKGVSTGDFSEALEAILGPNAPGLSATNIVRLKALWEDEYKIWEKRDLAQSKYVYWWVDGIHFDVRLSDDRPCILVIMGATEDGHKELIAVWDGMRESKASWQDVLRDLKSRGISSGPKLAIGDGALGFWSAVEEEFPETMHQRCWVHKTGNILDKMPKSIQPEAKQYIHEMYMAPTREKAMKAYSTFCSKYDAKYPKAVACLVKDKDVLFSFYDFPAHHWAHLRTTNPIESTFATVRHRTRQTKGCGSRTATLSMVYKLCMEAQKGWRRLRGYEFLPRIIRGERCVDGEFVEKIAA